MLSLYKNIHDLRVQNKMTQLELADRLGYTRSMIAKIESGKVDLAQSKILEIAKIFGVDPGELMGLDGTEHPIDTEEAKAIRDLYTNVDAEILEAAENDPQLKEFIQLFLRTAPDDRPAVLQILKGLQRNS